MAIVTVGMDLAKSVFAVHGLDESSKPALVRPEVPRGKLLEWVAKLPPCLMGMDACSGAHHGAREFMKFGHTVRLMAPKFVAPYRMSGKRGKNDAWPASHCAGRLRPFGLTNPIRCRPTRTDSRTAATFIPHGLSLRNSSARPVDGGVPPKSKQKALPTHPASPPPCSKSSAQHSP